VHEIAQTVESVKSLGYRQRIVGPADIADGLAGGHQGSVGTAQLPQQIIDAQVQAQNLLSAQPPLLRLVAKAAARDLKQLCLLRLRTEQSGAAVA
jgi:hypothetical protein